MAADKKAELLKRRRLQYAVARASREALAAPASASVQSMFQIGETSRCSYGEPTSASTGLPRTLPLSDSGPPRRKKSVCAQIESSFYPRRRIAGLPALPTRGMSFGSPPPAYTGASILHDAPDCEYCSAKRFYREPPSFCCSEGEVRLAPTRMPEDLLRLFTSTEADAVQFRRYVRTYNNHLAFTTFGAKTDPELMKNSKGIYTFSVQGKVYHNLPPLQSSSVPPRNLQLYMYDGEAELDQRLTMSSRLDRGMLTKLLDILRGNPYVVFLRQLKDLENLADHRICLVNTPKLDQRVFNEPTTNDVAAILSLEDESDSHPECHIQIYAKDAMPYKISHNYASYDALQYPMFFVKGEGGWHFGIEKLPPNLRKSIYRFNSSSGVAPQAAVNAQALVEDEESGILWHLLPLFSYTPQLPFYVLISNSSTLLIPPRAALAHGTRKRNIVSCRQYYCYKLQMRDTDRSGLLHGGRLLQQYIVDMFVKVESCRLEYIRKQQKEIRTEFLQGLLDSIGNGTTSASSVGRKAILPPSFMGGPRDMRRRYLDAMALVQQFGRPDFFLTMTCNPAWKEISKHLLPGELPQNRPDLLSQVFKAKLEMLKKDLLKDHIFGTPNASVYSIEFQKRGLPHVHLLIILDRDSKPVNPEAYDRYISAELPDPDKDPELFSLVTRHMIHGPCGALNMRCPCMRNSQCKNRYPRSFLNHTNHGEDSYPLYRRRDTGISAMVRGHRVDNKWVVPYNPYLLKKYDCHINVEVCSTIKLVKYLYKYIYKGPDRVAFQLSTSRPDDEILDYQKGRWVSPPEVAWRLYSFPLFEIHPAVVTLQIHLPNNYILSFRADADLPTVVTNSFLAKTMLTQFFYMNKFNERAVSLKCLYKDFPRHFVWDGGKRFWSERKKGKVVGRVVSVPPTEGERYYLRLLLNHVNGPTSFDDLLTVQGCIYASFRDSALHRGLLTTDMDLYRCLDEAVTYQMPRQLRALFASILVYCSPSNPKNLWEKYSNTICEDYLRVTAAEHRTASNARRKALSDIAYLLDDMGKSLHQYALGPEADYVCRNMDVSKEIEHERSILVDDNDLIDVARLNAQQRHAYDAIMEKAMTNQPTVFFVDGPGGTGKTFLYKTILATIRAQNHVAIATATSGIAASVLPGGRTAHSRFKLPLHTDESQVANVSKQSGLARLVRESKVIIWDEAPMAHRKSMEAFAEMLRDVTNVDRPFGNKVVVFGGDFRQVLPVITNSTRLQQINACLISSPFWPSFQRIELTENMRALHDPEFTEYLLRIGNGTEVEDADGYITLPTNMVIPFTELEVSLQKLIHFVYPDIDVFRDDPTSLINRAILAPTNTCVDDINAAMLANMPGEISTYHSTDVALDLQQQGDYEDFLNTLNPSSLPPHKLQLRVNSPVILLRNLNPTEGLCNGTRLICKELRSYTIVAVIASGPNIGEVTILHRIPLEASNEDKKSGIPFKRHQFPIRLCFAMTINKAQGQTLDRVGVYLREPVFSHGQLYVALSRAKKSSSIRVLIVPPELPDPSHVNRTQNIVFREIVAGH